LPPGELFSQANENSVVRVLLVGDAEVREEDIANGSYTRSLIFIRV
jgi:hypothetical protein